MISKLRIITILAVLTCLLTLTTLGLVSSHTQMRCSTKVNGSTNHQCPPQIQSSCDGVFSISGSGSTYGSDYSFNYTCAWNKFASVTGLIGLALTQIFLVILVLKLKGKNTKISFLGFAGLIVVILLVSLTFMIRDLKLGSKTKYGDHIIVHSIDTVLLIGSLLLIVCCAFIGDKYGKEQPVLKIEKICAEPVHVQQVQKTQTDGKESADETCTDIENPKLEKNSSNPSPSFILNGL